MSAVWAAVKRSCHCKDSSDVHEPKLRSDRSRKRSLSSCKCRINEVGNGRKRPTNCSPLSIRSSDLVSPFSDPIKFSSLNHNSTKDHSHVHVGGSPNLSPVSRLVYHFNGGLDSMSRTGGESSFRHWLSQGENSSGGCLILTSCDKCGEPLTRQDVEEHYFSKHAVCEVQEGDQSRKIIEMILRAGWTSSDNRPYIENILKLHHPQTKLAQFEEYREMVKIRASRLQQHAKKHPRCLADGNELLRFYSTTVACGLGQNGSSSLCSMQGCNLCCVLRHGFSSRKGLDQSVLGIFTTSTGEKAYKSLELENGEEGRNTNHGLRKALMVCRVIAGRVHKPMVENFQVLNVGRRLGFDSLAGKMGSNGSHVEELYLLNPTALLPCFVILCK